MDVDGNQDHYVRRLSRRFTTLEGWREVRGGLYIAAGSAISSVTPNPAYDHEWQVQDDSSPWPRTLWLDDAQHVASGGGQNGLWPLGNFSAPDTQTGEVRLARDPAGRGKNNDDPSPENLSKESMGGASTRNALEKSPERFHSFTTRKKWGVIVMIGAAGLFSGLSSNIYFPALDLIATDFGVSLSMVTLTITSYLIIQGISPLFWGPLSEALGRRPVYIYSFSVYIAANIVLSISPNFVVLLLFRGLQSAGSASTVSIGNGVIQDISEPVERGAFISFYQAIRNFSIAIGPVVGGLLARFLGFRSIFIFLASISSMVLIAILLFLPETLRFIAGDGTLRLSGIHQPLRQRFQRLKKQPDDVRPQITHAPVTVQTFIAPLKLLMEKDILVSLVFGGTVYTVWSMVVASTTGLFNEHFQLDELKLGLIFFPNGFGTIIGSAIAGKLMTREFLRYEERYVAENPSAPFPSKNKKDLPWDFPIEHARLCHTPWITALFAVSTAVYGFTLLSASQLRITSRPGWIAVPLSLQFLIAATSNAIFAINTTLVADLCPGKAASASAINNLVRCSMGALGVGFVDVLISSVGPAVTFLSLSLTTLSMAVLLAVEWSWGMDWRRQRGESNEKSLAGKGWHV